MKTISDNLAAVGEPVKDRDHILQLLGGLGPDYNSIVASLTAREDDLSLHSVHSILLTHEQDYISSIRPLQIFLLPLPIWLCSIQTSSTPSLSSSVKTSAPSLIFF
ncbi:hypothetical protein CK203_042375 [Vitis vinifera]|uniref:Retrovirus-related Pol polyprotein from transposon RE1 n=1 Tax=Vitis vinifera TaxID=29760 RepID=A0A438H5Y1_VITVI|nr:hypothetical protein CK203_042375 [Vitis vinifera]